MYFLCAAYFCELDVTRHIWKEVISIEEVSPSGRSIGMSMEISLIITPFGIPSQ